MNEMLIAKILIGTLAGLAALIVTFRMAFIKPLKVCGFCNKLPSQCQCGAELITLAMDWLEAYDGSDGTDDPYNAGYQTATYGCGYKLREVLERKGIWIEGSSPSVADGDNPF